VNYAFCGKALKLDLLVTPALLLDWDIGARSAAWYWDVKGLAQPCELGLWESVRRIVNGGLTHYADFLGIIRGFGLAV
jgi:putative chitinase